MRTVCDLYAKALSLHNQGAHVVSCDEKTIQALERARPARPLRPGLVARLEYEYVRHRALCLIANFDVATSRVESPTIGLTRSKEDFAAHIVRTIDTDPDAAWIFVADNLNTHNSETLVRLVAERCGLDVLLGVKDKSGVLRIRHTRAAFLSDPGHRVRFVYTPKHCSWLNRSRVTCAGPTSPARITRRHLCWSCTLSGRCRRSRAATSPPRRGRAPPRSP